MPRPPPSQKKYGALDALLALMHAREPWDVRSLEAQPSLEAVRAAIREADTRGRNSCAYFLRENAFSPTHFASALADGEARYEYVAGVLARAWAGRELTAAFAHVSEYAFLGCGIGGFLFVRACLPARLDNVFYMAPAFVALVGPCNVGPELREALLEHACGNVPHVICRRILLEVAFNTERARAMLASAHRDALELALEKYTGHYSEADFYSAVLAGAFASRDVDVYRRVFARFTHAPHALYVTRTSYVYSHLHVLPTDAMRLCLSSLPLAPLKDLLALEAAHRELDTGPALAEVYAASAEPRRDTLRRALLGVAQRSVLDTHWPVLVAGVHESWWADTVARWDDVQFVTFVEFAHSLERNTALDTVLDVSLCGSAGILVHGDAAVAARVCPVRFPRLYARVVIETRGAVAPLRERLARVAYTPYVREALAELIYDSELSLCLRIEAHEELSEARVRTLIRMGSATMLALLLERVDELDLLAFLAYLPRAEEYDAIASTLEAAARRASQRALVDELMARLQRAPANYRLIGAAPYLDGAGEGVSRVDVYEVFRMGELMGEDAASAAAVRLVQTRLMRKRAHGAARQRTHAS